MSDTQAVPTQLCCHTTYIMTSAATSRSRLVWSVTETIWPNDLENTGQNTFSQATNAHYPNNRVLLPDLTYFWAPSGGDWRERIHTLLPPRVRAIRSIQLAHIADHLVKLPVVLIKESRFLTASCQSHGDADGLRGHLESYTPGTCQYVLVRTDLYQPVL